MMTKYERARVLGARTLQLSLGAPPVGSRIDIDPLKTAEAELRDKKIPMAVKRE
jgi:DNA-directed RNA polymerase subunit K/omega